MTCDTCEALGPIPGADIRERCPYCWERMDPPDGWFGLLRRAVRRGQAMERARIAARIEEMGNEELRMQGFPRVPWLALADAVRRTER